MSNWYRPSGNFGKENFSLIYCNNKLRNLGNDSRADVVQLNLKKFGAVDDIILEVREGFECLRLGEASLNEEGSGCLPGLCAFIKNTSSDSSKKVFEVLSVTSSKGEILRPQDYSAEIVSAVESLL